MLQQPRDELAGQGGQLPFPGFVVKQVAAILEQRHIHVHSVARRIPEGLGHKGGVKAVLLGQGLDCQLEGHDVVGRSEGVRVLQVDLVLPGGGFMVAGLDLHPHFFQGQRYLPPGALTVVQRAKVEVPRLIGGPRRGTALLVGLEQEELQLRPYMESIPQLLCFFQRPLEDVPGVPVKGSAVRIINIADQPGHLSVLGTPRQDGEGVQVRAQILVRLLHPDRALYGAAVQHDLPVQCPPDLGGRNCHVFQLTEKVGELHPDKLDVLLLHQTEDVLPAIASHRCLLPAQWP